VRTLATGAHPDDIETMLDYALMDAEYSLALVAADGEAGIDMTGTCLCPCPAR
jgi:hypothetical protein